MSKKDRKAEWPLPLDEGAFQRAALRGVLQPAMPYLEEELRRLEEVALKRAFAAIQSGQLTSEVAVSILMEVKSYRDLCRKMRARSANEPAEYHG